MQCSVMTFNLRYNEVKDGGNAWPHRVAKAAEVVLRHQPDVFGTQEGLQDMLAELSERLPAYRWIGEGRMGGREDEHNAIFYKPNELKMTGHGQFWLSETPEAPGSRGWDSSLPRICTWACFEALQWPGRSLAVYNTHLDHVGQKAREEGAALIWRRMRRHCGELPVVLMGDFNAHPDNPVLQFLDGELEREGMRCTLKNAYAGLPGGAGLTAHGFRGGNQGEPIDYIFVSEQLKVSQIRVLRDRIGGGYPSDHYPVLANLED